MTITQHQALQYYSNLLILQYNSLPKASQTIQVLANCSVCDGFFFQLQNCFDLTTAVGNQLTIIGKIVGVPRQIYGLDLTDTFFTFSNFSGLPASVGFNTFSNGSPDPDRIASWYNTDIYVPSDFEMLALIHLKIIANTFYTSLGQIVPALYELFGDAITLTDNFNTSISYTFANPYHNVGSVAAFLGNICPKPMGVAISYANV